MNGRGVKLGLAVAAAIFSAGVSTAGEKLVADGQTVVFLGDSITCYGAIKPDGYVKLVVSGLAANGINVKWFGAGVAGHKAWHMKERFEKDVLARKPDLVTISAGVNDVWFPGDDCTPEKFRADMQDMITRAKQAGIRVVLLTPTSAYANEGDDLRIRHYAKCVEELATANGVTLADTRKVFRALVDDPASPKIDAQGRKATVDGVHLAPTGNRAFAREVLRAFGLNDAERAKAEEEWNTKPFCPVSSRVAVPYSAYCDLEAATDARKRRIEDSCVEVFRKGVEAMIADPRFDQPAATESVRPEAKCDETDIVFLGDRLVDFDRNSRSGLTRQIRLASAASDKDRTLCVIPTGVLSLNAAWDGRLAASKPDYLIVATYVFEIFSVKVDDAVAEVKTLVEKASAAGTKVILVTTRPTKNPDAEKKFNSALRALADGKRVFVLDQREILNDVVARRSANPYASFASVGFELNPSANLALGRALLPMLGFSESEIAKASAGVEKLSDFADIWANACLTFGEYDALLALAKKNGKTFPAVIEQSLRRGVGLQEKGAAKTAGERLAELGVKAEVTKGYAGSSRYTFAFEGFRAYFDEPENPKEGRQWMWCMKWPNAFAERTGQADGVARGYYYVYIDDLKWMSPAGTEVAKRFHDFLVRKLGFAEKAFLVGMSWGGFYSTRYAATYPDDVARVYLDAPLMNFAQFDLGSYPQAKVQWGEPKRGDWEEDPRMPVNLADKIAKSGIPVLLLYGGADTVVPPAGNCEKFAERYRAAGGKELQVFRIASRGHHPHGFDGADKAHCVVDFFEGKPVK